MKKIVTLSLIIISLFLISGCVSTCPASCDDDNLCTSDFCSANTDFKCVYEKIKPCCGNNLCERDEGESYNSCSSDCEMTKEDKEKNDAEKKKVNSIININIDQNYDEFEKITWYKYKQPFNYYYDSNIFLYFAKYDDELVPSNLRIKINYYGNDWLFIERYGFSIDGKSFEYAPYDFEREVKSAGKIHEWSDQQVNSQSCKIIKKIINSESAKIRYYGDTNQKTETINPIQKYAMRNVLYVYSGLGGSLPDCFKNINLSNNFIDDKKKECIANDDCKSYSKSICYNNLCVECAVYSDCKNEDYPQCVNNECVQCVYDSDCIIWGWYSEFKNTKILLTKCKKFELGEKSNLCVECLTNNDCVGTAICLSNNVCFNVD